MPSKSKAQARLMAAAAHNPAFAKKVGVPVSVAKEFNQADKGKKFGSGGMAKKEMHSEKGEMKADVKQDKAMIKKAVGMHDKQLHGGKKTNLSKLRSGGLAAGHKSADGIAQKGKTKATAIKMAGGGCMMKKSGRGR